MQNTDDSHKMSSSLVLNGVFNEKKQSKKHRSNDQGGSSRSSSSSQGSSRNGALVLRTSSSSEEDDKAQPRVKKTKRPKKPLTRHQFSVEDEDDERTDSADEGDKPFNPPFTQSNSYPGPMLRPLSPTLMSVGYGADLRPATHTSTHKDDVIDITPTVLESPNPQVPPCAPLSPDIQGGDSVLPLAGNVTGASVLPSPITNTLPFAGWYPPLYSPFCGGSGSMATTPAAGGENGPFISPGTSVILQATICNESEGILIINVRWRNKSFSGSLIDLNRHQWAPPKLAEGFTDLQIQVKDLYKKQESEKVVVDIDGDTAGKDKDGDVDRNMEITVTKEDHTNKSGFSDISDASDGESKLSEKKASVPVVTADDSNHNKPAIALPSFDAVKSPQPEFRRDGAKNSTKEDAPPSPAEQPKPTASSKPHSTLSLPYIGDSSAEEGRSVDHHNLNTLVDVATKMKPVTGQGDPKPPDHRDSDSSGSGSVSPEKKKALSDKQQEGGKGADNPVVSKQPDTPGLGPQLFNFTMPPISPGDSDLRNTKRQMKPPPPPDHLRAQWNATDTKPSVIPSIVSFSNMQHGNSPALYHQAPSVIQGNSGKPRKRKLQPQNEANKRVSPPPIKDGLPPPIKDALPFVRGNDKMALPPLPMSFTSSRPEAPNAQRRDHHHNDQPPPGFTFDPSLPMPYDYQLISYKEQLKSSEEAAGDESHIFSKIMKRPKPIETHDTLSVNKPTRSPSPNLRRPLLHSGIVPHDQRIQFSPHGNKPERPPSKDSHSVVKSHKKHPIQRKPEYSTHTIKKDPDGPPQPLFMSATQGVFMPQLSSSAPSSQTVTLPQMSHWPVATAIPQGGKPIKSDPSEHHSSSQHRSTPSPHLPIAKNKPHIVDNKPHSQHHGNKHDSSRHHISSNASSNNLSQISPTNTLRNGAILPQQVVPEEWLKQMQMMQLEQLQNAGATPTIPMALHHQELAMWQSQLMQLMNAGRGDQALQIQQQLALQQQQMIQSDAAMAQAFASPGMVPFMPLPGFQGMVPYLPPTQKRDS